MNTDLSSTIASRKQAATISLIVGFCMLIVKMLAYFLTHSAAILSDAIESVVHIAATSMAFYSVVVSARPADDSHPYGHGKIDFFSAGIEGGLIVLAAVAIIYEAIRGIVFGRELTGLGTGILLTLGASAANLLLGLFLIRRGKATSSLILIADGKHILTDSYTSFGVVVGIGLVMLTGIELLDPLVAIAVALNIIFTGYKLIRVSVGGLMDESDKETLHRIALVIADERSVEWIMVHLLRVMRSGAMYHVDFHLMIPFYWNVRKAGDFQHAATAKIAERLNGSASILIHLDPCVPQCCSTCNITPCPERKQPFAHSPDWSLAAITAKALYGSSPF